MNFYMSLKYNTFKGEFQIYTVLLKPKVMRHPFTCDSFVEILLATATAIDQYQTDTTTLYTKS
jgi:hypothetical protein